MIDVSGIDIHFEFNENIDSIRSCLSMLFATRIGEQPLDRSFGIDYSFLDMPLDVAKNMFVIEVVKKMAAYETRAEVSKVDFEFDVANGRMRPIIYLKKGECWDGGKESIG